MITSIFFIIDKSILFPLPIQPEQSYIPARTLFIHEASRMQSANGASIQLLLVSIITTYLRIKAHLFQGELPLPINLALKNAPIGHILRPIKFSTTPWPSFPTRTS
jgi:hypothetical protein